MKRLIGFIVGIVLVIGCVVAPLVLFRPENYRKTLTDQLSKLFRHPVLIGTIEGHYLPPQVELKNFNVLKTNDVRYLSVDDVTLSLGWGALFGQPPAPDRVQFSGAHVAINRLPDGGWDSKEWWPAPGKAHDKKKRPDIVVKNSEIVWIDTFAPAHAELQVKNVAGEWLTASNAVTLSGELGGAALPAVAGFRGKGPLEDGDWSGEATFTENGRKATFMLRRQGGYWQATGNSQEWRLDNAAALARFYLRLRPLAPGAGSSFLRDWKVDFTSQGSTTTFSHSATLDGGTTEVKGTVDEKSPAHVALTAALQNVPVASLKPILGELGDGIEGKLTGLVSRFGLSVSSSARENAFGDFVFELAEGSYRLPDATLRTLKKVKTANYLRKKFPEFEDKGFPFTKLRVQGTVEQGGISVQEAGLISGDVRAAATGRLDVTARALDLWLQLQIHEVLPVLRKELPERYVYGEPGREKVQPIFGHLQGPWSEWKLRASPASRIPAAARKKLHAGLTV